MKKVLIVEDKKLIRQGIRAMMERTDVPIEEIVECKNGKEALDYLKGEMVDLVFSDIRMPVMDGITLVKEIQTLDPKPEIVVLSAYDNFEYAVELMKYGIRYYLLKPVERSELASLLKTLQEEFEDREAEEEVTHTMWMGQLKYLFAGQDQTELEKEYLWKQFTYQYQNQEYVVCTSAKALSACAEEIRRMFVGQLNGDYVYVFRKKEWKEREETLRQYALLGISKTHRGFSQLKEAYLEAVENRQQAFIQDAESIEKDIVQEKMKQAIYYMNENYQKDITLAVVSNYVSMNYTAFSTSFKQYTGMNFVSYLKKLRIDEAKRLLQQTDEKIREISHKVGYENERHFMKTFKSVCGVSPSEYRKMHE